MRVLMLVFLAWACLGTGVWGQVTPEPEHAYTFRVFKHHYARATPFLYQADRQTVEAVTFWRGQRSPDHAYRGPAVLTFFTEAGVEPETGEPLRVPQAQVTLPDHREPWLLFFFPAPVDAPEDSLPWRVVLMSDGEHGFPDDHLRFVNATGVTLAGIFGADEITLPPGASPPIDLTPYDGDAILVGLGIANGDVFERAFVSQLRFASGARRILLLLPPRSARSFRLLVREVVDFPQRQREQEAERLHEDAPEPASQDFRP